MWPFGKRAKEKSPPPSAETILHDLDILARIEGVIARFYHLCGEVFPEDQAFWQEMAASERTHVQHIHKMQELIRRSPHLFKPDQQFAPASIRLFEISVKTARPRRSRNNQPGGAVLPCGRTGILGGRDRLRKDRDVRG